MSADSPQTPEDSAELRDCWYSIAKLCEGLGRYGSARDEGFEGSLESILSAIDSFEKLLEGIYQSITQTFPTYPSKIESQKDDILEEAKGLKERIEGDRRRIVSIKKKDEEGIKAELKNLRQKYEDLERETSEKCNKYFERKREYTIAFEKIEKEVSKRLVAVRDAFVERTADVAEGYEVSLDGTLISPGELFDAVIEGRANAAGINLRSMKKGGLFDTITGEASKRDKAKESVLRYGAQEIAQKARPLKKKEAELIAKLDQRFNDLKGLEDDCKGAEEKRERIVDARDRLRTDLGELDASENLKDTYLEHFDKATPKVESLISLIKVIGESGAIPEEERGELLAEIEKKEEELDSILVDMGGASRDELLACKERLGKLKSQIKQLEAEIEKQL